ncbi:MAG: hypothetical protein ACREMQ_10835 [Longimicrobiales bacterium]
MIDGARAMVVSLDVTPAPGSRATRLTAKADIATQDGSAVEIDPPLHAARPRIVRWQGPGNQLIRDTQSIEVPATGTEQWTVTVEIPDDTVVSVGISGDSVAD